MQESFLGPGDIDLCVAKRDVFVIALEWPDPVAEAFRFIGLGHRFKLERTRVEGDAPAVVLTH